MKNLNILLSAAMLVGAVAAVNCADKAAEKTKAKAVKAARKSNASKLRQEICESNKNPKFKYGKKYMGVLLEVKGNKKLSQMQIFDLDTKECVLDRIEKMIDFQLKEDEVVIFYGWGSKKIVSLKDKCKKCGKFASKNKMLWVLPAVL